MSVNLRHLRYFVAVVDAGSFSRAAATIRVAQPALSRQVVELERIVGADLLVRTARGVHPTEAGEALHREAVAILRQVERLPDIAHSAGGNVEGVVGLGMSSTLASFLSGSFMEACRIAFPQVTLRLTTNDSNLLKSRIDAGRIDIALVYEDDPTPGYSRMLLYRQRLYLVGRGPFADGATAVPVTGLGELPLVLPAHPNVTRFLLDRVFAEAGIVPNMVGEADVMGSLLAAARSGLGDIILPKGDLSDVPGSGDLLALPIEPPVYLTAAILSSGETALSHTAAVVRDLLARFVFDLMTISPPPGAEWIGSEPPMPRRHGEVPKQHL